MSLLSVLGKPSPVDQSPRGGSAPVSVILCQGGPAQMGRQQGRQLAEPIRRILATLQHSKPFAAAKPAWLPRPLWPATARGLARRWLRKAIRTAYPRQFERAVAIAEAAGVPESFVWLALATEIGAALPAGAAGGCTAATLGPERTEFAEPAMIKNFDFLPDFAGFDCVRRNAPSDRFASLDVTYPPLPGCHDGINEAGLALSYNYAYPADAAGRPRWPISLLCQELLERCRSVPEAVEAVSQMPRSSGAILLLSDAEGRIAAVELSPQRMKVRHSSTGHLVAANHYRTAHLTEIDLSFAGRDTADHQQDSIWLAQHSRARSDRLDDLLQARSRWDLPALWQLLADHGPRDTGGQDTICRHPPPYRTNVALLLLPRRRQLWIAMGPPCKNEPVVVELDA